MKEFLSKGYERTHMKTISTTVGLSKNGIRTYFDKDSLFHAVVQSIENDKLKMALIAEKKLSKRGQIIATLTLLDDAILHQIIED